jgi:hypothetical protein
MTTPREPDSIVAAWLEEGPTELPEATRRAIAVNIRTTHQTRRLNWVPWRNPSMNPLARLAVIAAGMVVAIGGAVYILTPGGQIGGQPSTVAPSSAPPSPSQAPSPSQSASPMDTATWTTYTSERYGITIAHPADFTERPAVRDWTFEADAANWLSTAQESFVRQDGQLRVSAWSVAVEPGTTVEAWIQAYCSKNTEPCTGIADRAIAVYAEPRDRHPGLLVSFADDVQAFFLSGDRISVIASWRPDSHSSVASYGGSIRLVEAMALSMTLGIPAPTTTTPPPS